RRIGFDRWHDDDDVAYERGRNGARVEPRSPDLYIDDRLQLADERLLAHERLELGADLDPLGLRRARLVRLQRAPRPGGEMRSQPPPQVHGLADIERAARLVSQNVDSGCRGRGGADSLAGAPPRLAPIFHDKRLGNEAPRKI